MKLYYSPGACSLSDHIVLEWIGQPYEAVRVSREDRQTAEYLAINPAGAVPALAAPDGWVLTQNAAILNYLADSHPEAGLGGDGSARSRAEVNRWLGVANADIHPAFHPLFGSTAYLGDADLIDRTKQAAATKLRGLFARVDRQLEGRDWITGSRSIADPYLFVVTRWARAMDIDLSGFDNLARFFDTMLGDAGVQRALLQEGAT
ncbi:glutathione S-transferase family protein [Cognatiluteimonas profundi]|uniref:glutathione S-transferase family protein n=1 Tax=Cognatiluteimonas profundi TaxID=2594501 RepID=UPI00131E3B35|nr:glutathione S-transferase N-terminal domain-containing protein [Lysobacter profundi]